MINSICYRVVFAALALISTTTAKSYMENELKLGKSLENAEILSEDPRYSELEKQVENFVQEIEHNITSETVTYLSEIINKIDFVYNHIEEDCKKDVIVKLSQLKGSALKGFCNCPEQKKIKQHLFGLGVNSLKLSGEIRRLAEQSLTFCMSKDTIHSVVCRINPFDETNKRLDKLKTKVDQFITDNSKYYQDLFVLKNNCYNKENFEDELERIKNSCK